MFSVTIFRQRTWHVFIFRNDITDGNGPIRTNVIWVGWMILFPLSTKQPTTRFKHNKYHDLAMFHQWLWSKIIRKAVERASRSRRAGFWIFSRRPPPESRDLIKVRRQNPPIVQISSFNLSPRGNTWPAGSFAHYRVSCGDDQWVGLRNDLG